MAKIVESIVVGGLTLQETNQTETIYSVYVWEDGEWFWDHECNSFTTAEKFVAQDYEGPTRIVKVVLPKMELK